MSEITLEKVIDKIEEKNKVVDTLNEKFDDITVKNNARIDEVEKKMASFSVPNMGNQKDVVANELAKSLLEKKEIKNASTGLTQNGTGNIQVVSEIIRGMVEKNKLAKLTRQFWGDNTQVSIPVFLPGMAQPTGGAEGDSGKSMDSTASLNPVSLIPYEFFAGLEVSRLLTYTTSLESSLSDIFDDAFGQAWDYQIVKGTGNFQFTGIYDSTWIASVASACSDNIKTASSATAVTWKDMYKLAEAIKAKASGSEKLAIICHNDIISDLLAPTDASPALEMIYLATHTIADVPVILSSWAPNTMTTGLYVACAVDLNKYATAWVRDFTIEPVKQKGTSNIYEQGFIYANGKPIDKSSFFYLKLA